MKWPPEEESGRAGGARRNTTLSGTRPAGTDRPTGDRTWPLQFMAASQVIVAPERWLTSTMCVGAGGLFWVFFPLQAFRMFLLFSNQRKSLFLIFGAEGEGVRF